MTNDLVILGSAIADNYYENNPSGVIRAYDVRTGAVIWKFDGGKPDDTKPLAPGELYEANSAVAWTQFSADENLGMVYVPFGNKSPDQVGVFRSEEDAQSVDALAALDLKTGQLRWKFQTSKHDLWDAMARSARHRATWSSRTSSTSSRACTGASAADQISQPFERI